MTFNLFCLLIYIETCDTGLAGSRSRQPAKHAHSGGLSGTIGTEETEYLSLSYLKTYMVYCRKVSEALRQVVCFYYVHYISN